MKKLFAVILALSMIAAMLPAGTVFAADETVESYEYIFSAAAIGETEKTNIYTTTSGKFSHGLGDVESGNAWKGLYALGSAANEVVMVHNTANFLQFAAQSDSEEAAARGNAVVFQLYLGDYKNSIPANSGVYIPTVEDGQHGKQYHYGITDLYLVSSDTVKENGWSVSTLENVQTIINSAAKLGSGNESPMADVIHLSSDDGNKASYENEVDFFEVAKKVKLDGGNYYLIATVSKPDTGWKKSSSASYTDNEVFGNFSKITFTREADDTELASAFKAKEENHTPATKNVYGYKSTDTANAIVKHENVTNKVTVSTEDTENFLFWAQGLTNEKKILSFEPSFEYTPSEGNNILVAVYEDNVTKRAEFFNANGQREDVLLADGIAPSLPERVGYKPANTWVDLEGNKIAPGDSVTVSGYNAYVPNYGELISVTVNGTLYNYGDTVTLNCNDDAYYKEGKYFKGWKKDNVIVSTSESYSFLAYKDTTVTAEWADEPFNFSGSGRKIILDAFDSALMAEFIGFENVLEKGIMLDDTKLAMKTDSNQFVIIPDKPGTYKGYAIIEDDGAQKLVTDGEYIKAAE